MENNSLPEVKSRVWIPILITVAWLIVAAGILYIKRDCIPALKINEIGDSLAGFFSPVAFLWLVYGYLQQGKELKLSSDALRLQAQELQNSVAQQKALVEIGQSELAAIQSTMAKQIEQEKERFRPKFQILSQGSGPGSTKQLRTEYTIKNLGCTISALQISSEDNDYVVMPSEFDVFLTDQTITFYIETGIIKMVNLPLKFDYLNGEGQREAQLGIGIPIQGGVSHQFARFQKTSLANTRYLI